MCAPSEPGAWFGACAELGAWHLLLGQNSAAGWPAWNRSVLMMMSSGDGKVSSRVYVCVRMSLGTEPEAFTLRHSPSLPLNL